MASFWVPAPTPAQTLPAARLPDSPFHQLRGLTRAQLRTTRDMPAAERRLLLPNFIETFRWAAVRPRLPLRLVVAPTQPAAGHDRPATPPLWRPRTCRSHYVWLPPEDALAASPAAWQGLDDCDLILRLFDFSAWRPILGQRFASQCGPPPFDPVSLGLAWLLARWRGWSWPQLVTELQSVERGQGYVRRLGFCPDDLPSASTYRMALHATPPDWVVQCADSLTLSLLAYGIIPSHSTFPQDPPARGVSVALDSQLVAACSHLRCRHMHANCFQPPAAPAMRAAPATRRRVPTTVGWPPHATRRRPTSTTAAPTSPRLRRPPPRPARPPAAPPPAPSPSGANITSATRARPTMSSTTACSPTGRWPAPMWPPTATTICKPFPASPTCAAASLTSRLAQSRPMPVRATTTSCATSTLTCTPYA